MSSGQWRVLILLAVLLGVDILVNPTARDTLTRAKSGDVSGMWSGLADSLAGGVPQMYGWGIGALALVALAAVAPDLATWIVVLFIAIVALSHAADFSELTTYLSSLTTIPTEAKK